MYRDYYHSFWNDDLSEKGKEGYKRRITRIQTINAKKETVLFVRAVASTEELLRAGELAEMLLEKFGPLSHLLVIVNFQRAVKGACILEGTSNLMVYLLEGEAHADPNGTPYSKPILAALDWAAGQDIDAMTFPALENISKVVDIVENGLTAIGGLRSFEESVDGSVLTPDVEEEKSVWAASTSEPLGDSEMLENACKSFVKPIYDDGVYGVSLGCSAGTKMSLQLMGRGFIPLPFDWIRTTIEGIVHFLNSDFANFFDFDTSNTVPGQAFSMYRSKRHSFWHDDPTSADVQTKYKQRIDNLRGLREEKCQLLFVRSVACSDEILAVDSLLDCLHSLFGELCCLLLIVDFQHTSTGVFSVEDKDDLLVHFLPASVHDGETASAPYRAAISDGFEWMKGGEMESQLVTSLEELHQLSQTTRWGMCGLGQMNAFEGQEM